MFRNLIVALGAALASCGLACAAPLEVYGKLPSIEQAAVSPSGKMVAYILTDGEQRTVAVESVPDRKAVYVGGVGTAKLRDLTWAGDQHLILTASTAAQPWDVRSKRSEWSLAFDLDLTQGRVVPLFETVKQAQQSMNTISGVPEVRTVDGKPTVYVRGTHFISGLGRQGLFRVNLEKHFAVMVEPGRGRQTHSDWVIDASGQAVAQEVTDERAGVWTLMLKGPRGWREIQSISAPIDTPSLMGLGRDGKSVLVSIADETIGSAWRELSIETGNWGEMIRPNSGESTLHDPSSGRLIGSTALIGEIQTYRFFDPHDAAVWKGITKAFPGDLVTLVSWSDDRKKIVVRVDSPEHGPAYSLVDMNTGEAVWLGDEYAGLKREDLARVQPVRFKAADGLELTGYLTLPRDRPAKGLPLVVLAHGGPASRDRPGFDWWAQAIASRGYAVLQVNFRGSSGLGYDFLAAGFGEWGRKMQTDLSDGVRDLVRLGAVDGKRVCIVGGSYGGYAALAGATIDHGVYRCAVSVAGVADLRDLVTEPGFSGQRYWRRFVGAADAHDPILATYSPTARAAEASVPISLIHGRDDTVVPISHSRKMAAALQRAGKPVEFTELKGEDHWLSRGETRQQMLKLTVDFLERNNPPN